MTFSSSLMFASSLIFPKTEKKSTARKSFFASVVCIGLSIIPLIIVVCVTDGLISGMTERLIGLSSGHLEAYVSSGVNPVSTAQKFADYASGLLEVEGVVSVFPEIKINALAAGKSYRTGAEIRAVFTDIFEKNESFKNMFSAEEGNISDFQNSTDTKRAVIGKKIAQLLNVHVGDNFRIITTKSVNGKITPKLTVFNVCAIVSSGYQELDSLWVFIPLDSVYSFASASNSSFTIMVNTNDPFSSDLVKIQQSVKSKCGKYANVYRWDQVHVSEFENFSSTKIMLIFIMILIVLVASINISSAIIMLSMERKKEIAIIKSIGGTTKGITLSFLIAGLASGAGGVLIGVPLGLILSIFANQIISFFEKALNFFVRIMDLIKGIPLESIKEIKLMDSAYYLSTIPITVPVDKIVLISIFTIILSLVVSIIPSIKAGNEKPLETLRKI